MSRTVGHKIKTKLSPKPDFKTEGKTGGFSVQALLQGGQSHILFTLWRGGLCTAFLLLLRHPGRHQNALLILAAPRHKSARKRAQRIHRENRSCTRRAWSRFNSDTAEPLSEWSCFKHNFIDKRKEKSCRYATQAPQAGGAHGGQL